MTLLGLLTGCVLLLCGNRFRIWNGCLCFTIGKRWGGLSLGFVMLLSEAANEDTMMHELGHAIQNCKYGFLMPFLVGIPSVIRYWYRKLRTLFGLKNKTPYISIWFEGEATILGHKHIFLNT